jgi:hypothetical protein
MISDPLPPSGGVKSTGGSSSTGGRTAGTGGQGAGGFIVDCVVSAGGVGSSNATNEGAVACTVDPAPPQCSPAAPRGQAVVDTWRDSGPRRLVRSTDVALFDPPNIHLRAKAEGRRIRVQAQSDENTLTYRWQSDGQIEGEGQKVYWTPANEDDALCVVARGQGGVAIATLRATNLPHA